MLTLIDVSHHQGAIDFDAVIEAGVAGVIVKCIDGRLPDVDPRFEANWRAIFERRDRLVIGSYAFARPATDGGGEADGRAEAEDYARTMLEQKPGDDWLAVVDLERGGMDPSHSVQQNIDFLGAWEETCVAELGRSPMLYTGKNTWRDRMGWTRAFTHLRLWQADYSATPAQMPWERTMLQYTSDGEISGIDGRVDLNRFDGTVEDLRALARPEVRPRTAGPIFPHLDLAGSGPYDIDVARVQGLLLGLGQPRDGLVSAETGRPDGRRGPATRVAYANATGTRSTVVDWCLLLC